MRSRIRILRCLLVLSFNSTVLESGFYVKAGVTPQECTRIEMERLLRCLSRNAALLHARTMAIGLLTKNT
jgi:hypothetical protein